MTSKHAVWLTPLQVKALRDAVEFVVTAADHGRGEGFTAREVDRLHAADEALRKSVGSTQ